MTVHVICPCGAELSIDDASELATTTLMSTWYEKHPHVGPLPAVGPAQWPALPPLAGDH